MSTYIHGKNLMVLRRKSDKMALNVSYTEDGLKWTANKLGRALFYKRAFISQGKFIGDLTPSNNVYVERFYPTSPSGASKDYVAAECTWLTKALVL